MLLLLVVALLLGGCSGDDGTYRVEASFPQAVSLFEESRIKLMGQDVGLVRSIEVQGDRLLVVMDIRDDVPLPADVSAAIAPLSLIGERNVLLFPAWRPGDERVGDGHVIAPEDTRVPVEVDEALDAFTELALAVDPELVARVVGTAEEALRGNGTRLNRTIEQLVDLVDVLGDQDDDLLRVLDDLERAASTVTERREQVLAMVDAYAVVAGVLADEEDEIERFFTALGELYAEGDALLDVYGEQLPGDVATLAEVALRLEASADDLDRFVATLPALTDEVVDFYDPGTNAVRLRLTEGGNAAREILNRLLADLGLPLLPCVDGVTGQCGGAG